MRGNVKVVRVAEENEETEIKAGNYSGILDNYTFDMTLEEQP